LPERRSWVAMGRCPDTSAYLTCSIDPKEGVLMRAVIEYEAEKAPDVHGDRTTVPSLAWFVDNHPVFPTGGERRLEGLGWDVRRFRSADDALAELRASTSADRAGGGEAVPDLLIVMESPNQSDDDTTRLREALPPTSLCIFAVLAGSSALGDPGDTPGYALRILPFSPLDLIEFCGTARRGRGDELVATSPGALGFELRATVLLVDDNATNLLVGQAMLESLGYKVLISHDGLDAIDQCRRRPPQAVLMDLDMPVLRGIEAARRLRELQRHGAMPPFPVIAATSDATAEARVACEQAGMSAFLKKPLTLSTLRSELNRFIDPAFRRAG